MTFEMLPLNYQKLQCVCSIFHLLSISLNVMVFVLIQRLKTFIGTCDLETLFFTHVLSLVSQMVPMVWKKMELIPPLVFPSKN
jgi:hypothetical protein